MEQEYQPLDPDRYKNFDNLCKVVGLVSKFIYIWSIDLLLSSDSVSNTRCYALGG
jgi:hypothetical protein